MNDWNDSKLPDHGYPIHSALPHIEEETSGHAGAQPPTSTSTALVGPMGINPSSLPSQYGYPCVQQHSQEYDASTFVYHPAVTTACQVPSGSDHLPPNVQTTPVWMRQPLSPDGRSMSPSMYDEVYIQSLIAPYLAVSTDPKVLCREPSDLNGIISEKEILKIRRCGGGGFGDVYRLQHILLGDIALKRIREAGDEDIVTEERRRARREAIIWHDLEHPNVLKFIGVYETTLHFFFVCPFAKNGTIMAYIKGIPDVNRVRLLSEAACGLAYLHSQRIVHGDIKAANILISDDSKALICDFGMTRRFDAITTSALHGAGSIRWMSPETLDGETRTAASDVWSFGMAIFEILTGLVPYPDLRQDALVVRAIVEGSYQHPALPSTSHTGISFCIAWKVAAACWIRHPGERVTMDHAYQRLDISAKAPRTLEGHEEPVCSIAFSPDSRVLASSSCDSTIRLWDISQAVPLSDPLLGHTWAVWSVAFSSDGKTLVSSSEDNTLRLWDVSADRKIGEPLNTYASLVVGVTFSPDGRTIASGSGSGIIRIWDSVFRRCVAVLEGHIGSVRSVAFSPDGRTLVSGSDDRTVRRWDMTTYARIGEPMTGHSNRVWSVAFSPDGTTIASGSYDKTVRLWDARSGELKGSPLEGHTYFVFSVAFHPNGRLLASGSGDRTIRIWDLTTAPLATKLVLKGHTGPVCSVAFSSDGKWLASGSWDKTVRLWDLEALLGTV